MKKVIGYTALILGSMTIGFFAHKFLATKEIKVEKKVIITDDNQKKTTKTITKSI